MSILKSDITQMIEMYSKQFSNEGLKPLIDLLHFSNDITSRSNLPGHVTTSAVIINDKNQVLHIKHNALNKWLLPGGHCEKDDTTLVNASLREAEEETGISSSLLKVIDECLPMDIDLHDIPENPRKKEAEHWHADFRFAFRLLESTDVSLQEEEVADFVWLSFNEMPMQRLSIRLKELMDNKILSM